MKHYVVLIRGINVGGKNNIPMAQLRNALSARGFSKVSTYIASGNVLLESDAPRDAIKNQVEDVLRTHFPAPGEPIKALVLDATKLRSVVQDKPPGFGEQPDTYHSDVIFLIDIDIDSALAVFAPRDGVDRIWAGPDVVYLQRLSAERTKSRLNKIVGTPAYKAMTIRTWNTTTKLLELLEATSQ